MKTRAISKDLLFLFLVTIFTTISYGQKNVEQYNTNGLSTNVFTISEGKVTVYLPLHSNGETISGTIQVEAYGDTKKQKNKNRLKIKSYHLLMGEVSVSVKSGIFTIPSSTLLNSFIQLLNEQGPVVSDSYRIKGRDKRSDLHSIQIPSVVVSGEATKIMLNTDGDLANNSIKINGINAHLIAETESELFFETPSDLLGVNELHFTIGEDQVVANVHVITLKVETDKQDLFRGESAELSIVVKGIKGMTDKIPMDIINTTPRKINLEGGNYQHVMIDPEQEASSGTFRTSRSIKANQNGTFSIMVSIVPDVYVTIERQKK